MADNRITFTDTDGTRKTIRLGKLNKRETDLVESRVRVLLAAKFSGDPPPPDVATWLKQTTDYIREKLAAAGLVEARKAMTIGTWLEAFLEKRSDLKPSSVIVYRRCVRRLVEFFGEKRALRTITREDAADWRRFAATVFPSENTVRKMTGVARQFFTAAQRHRLIEENPFQGLAASLRENPDRFHFVSPQDAAKVLEACPTPEWRLLFALARWGGLRVPSEPLVLRWSDVDWEKNRLTVHSPKTEHHEGGEARVIPLFPEIRGPLEEAFDAAPEGAEFIITMRRDPRNNLRTQLTRIIRRAGLKPWPKLWHNLRSTRQTELVESYPIHVVCKWIGNTAAVAKRHYLQVLEDHFDRASRGASQQAPERSCMVAKTLSPETTKD